jgi:adenylate cyclase
MDDGASGDVHAWHAAGLYDPDAPDADDRLALLEHLVARGATLEELQRAAAEDRLVGLAGDLRRRGVLRLTARELAAETGLDMGLVLRVSRAAGLPASDGDVPMYRERDGEAFRLFAASMEVFGERAALEFTRTIGAGLAAIADAAMAIFGINIAGRFDERGVRLIERARAVEAATSMLTDQVPVAMETLFFHHVEAAIGRGAGTTTVRLAVGFVDLVRSTALVQALAPDELTDVIGTFEQHAVDLVGQRGGRVVKTIGDEVMFVVPSARVACEVALGMLAAVRADERLADARAGLAIGDLVRGYGDFFGPDVTTAARLVQLAEPGSVLVTEAVAAEAGPGLGFEPLPPCHLRGFAAPITPQRLVAG